jgi:dCMP deaminase
MYITLSPCRWCVKVIIAVGITRVVYDEKYNHDGSMELLQEAGIKVDCVNINP